MQSLIPSILVLSLVALVAALLAIRRSSPEELVKERTAASKVLIVTTLIQGAHFIEELATGFYIRFPALFDSEPMPLTFFVLFNIGWITIWIASVPFIRSARKFAFFAAWFLAIAGMLNAVAHPAMAIASGGYFPGLISSPIIGLAGVILWVRLQAATAPMISHETG